MSRATVRAGLDVEASLAEAAAGDAGGRVLVAGMDEVGRGALAGPVVVGVAAVWLPQAGEIPAVRDSKALSDARRRALVPQIHAWAAAACLGEASPAEIDRWGITGALALAGRRAWAALCAQAGTVPAALILDGSDDWTRHARSGLLADAEDGPVPPAPHMMVKAEDRCATVAAASIVAKVGRDDQMVALHEEHPAYGWAGNKGYGAAGHRAALVEHGVTEHHRRSWNLGVPDSGAVHAARTAPEAPTLFD